MKGCIRYWMLRRSVFHSLEYSVDGLPEQVHVCLVPLGDPDKERLVVVISHDLLADHRWRQLVGI